MVRSLAYRTVLTEAQRGPHDQAGFHPEGHLPGGEHRHVHPSASMNTLELAVVKSNRITVAVQPYAFFLPAYYM